MIEPIANTQVGFGSSPPHVIEGIVFDINFNHQQVADDFQQQAHDFMLRRLLPAIDSAFNAHNVPETMVSIDKLVIDLGNVEHGDYLTQIEIRVLEAISLQLACIKDKTGLNQSDKQVVSLSADIAEVSMSQYPITQGQWQQFTFYLLSGSLPWNGQASQYHDPRQWQQWLLQRVFTHSKKLRLWLATHGQRKQIIGRLVNQLTVSNVIELLLTMIPTNERTQLECMLSLIFGSTCQHRLTQTEQAFFTSSPWIKASEKTKRLRFLSSLFDDIVTDRHFSSNSACHYLLRNVSRQLDSLPRTLINDFVAMHLTQSQSIFLQHLPVSEVKSSIAIIFYQAVLQGSRAGLLSIWTLANKEYANVFVEVLTQLGKQARVRHCLATNLSVPMLTDLVLLLEPNESHFILQVQSNANQGLLTLKTQPQARNIVMADKAKEQIFWQFTLTYLLVERGGSFNRKSYLLSLIRQTSAHFNLSQQQVYGSLMDSLHQISQESKLKRNLAELLSDVTVIRGMTSGAAIESTMSVVPLCETEQTGISTQEILSRLAIAILEGRVEQITPFWSLVISEHSNLLGQALHLWGQERHIIRTMVHNFSQSMLQDILQCLAPADKPFILSMIELSTVKIQQSKGGIPLETQGVTEHLWAFSLSYLLIERGSQFNRISYLSYLTQQVAAHHNVDHQQLLHDLVSGFSATLAPSALKDSMLGLLGQLLIKPIEGVLRGVLQDPVANDTLIDVELVCDGDDLSSHSDDILSQFAIALHLADHGKIKVMIKHASHCETKVFKYIVMHFAKVSPQILVQLHKSSEQTSHYLMQLLMPNIMVLLDELMSEDSLLFVSVPFSDVKRPSMKPNITDVEISRLKLTKKVWYKLTSKIILSPFITDMLWLFIWEYVGVMNASCQNHNKVLHHLIVQMAGYRNLTPDSLIEAMLHCVKRDEKHPLRINQYQYLHSLRVPLSNDLIATRNTSADEQNKRVLTQSSRLDIEHLVYHNKLRAQLQVLMVKVLNYQRNSTVAIDRNDFSRLFDMLTELYQDDYLSLQRLMIQPLLLSMDWTALFKQYSHEQQQSMKVMVFNLVKYRQDSRHFNVLAQINSTSDLIYTAVRLEQARWSQKYWSQNGVIQNRSAEIKSPARHVPEPLFTISQAATTGKSAKKIDLTIINNPTGHNELQQCHDFLQKLANRDTQLNDAVYLKELDVILVYLKRYHHAEYKSYLLQYLPDIAVHLGISTVRSEHECHEMMTFLYGSRFRVMHESLCYLNHVCPTLKYFSQSHKKSMWSFMCQYINSSSVIDQTQLTVDFLAFVYRLSLDSIKSHFKRFELFIHQFIVELELPIDLLTHSCLIRPPLMGDKQNALCSTDIWDNKAVIEHLKCHISLLRGENNVNTGAIEKGEVVMPLQSTILQTDVAKTATPTSSSILSYDNILSNENIYVANAGIVIAAPYLPRLFAMLSLTDQGVFINDAAKDKAVHVLQYLVTEQQATPEYLLSLNKVLCGVNITKSISYDVELTNKDIETMSGLLDGIIQNWQVIGQTSISGLRESFLQREAVMIQDKGAWKLNVPPKTFDMLLDSIPWSFAVIKYPWMEKVLHVEWR